MGVVFVVLAILALSIKGISLLDREPSPETEEKMPAAASSPPVATPRGGITGEQVAAIAVALALSEPTAPSVPASISRAGAAAGSWLQSGRMRVLGSSSTGARERRS
jgi:Na+-transporting methylmalonyl-CoA/oxaloacetate decarboxylase gamma subunit